MNGDYEIRGTNGRPNLKAYADFGAANAEPTYWFEFHCAIRMKMDAKEFAQFQIDLGRDLPKAKASIISDGTVAGSVDRGAYVKLIEALYQV